MKRDDGIMLTPDQERARELVRALPALEADPAVKARLKRAFVSGELATKPRERTIRLRPALRFPRWIFAAAAVAAILVVVPILNRGPAPTIPVSGVRGEVSIDGISIPAAEKERIAERLRPGARISLSDESELDVLYAETVVYQLAPETEMTLPASPGRWYGRNVSCELDYGELLILTGPDFPGKRLVVQTPEGTTVVTATLISVFRDSTVTCVCVYHGTASVGIDAEDMEAVPSGMRKVMFSNGRPSIVTEIAPPHEEHLITFEKKYRF